MTDQPNDIDDVLNHRRDACQKPLDMSDAAQKAFADRQEKLIRSKRWPILNWYNDDDFCRAYNTAVALKAERDALAAELARLRRLEEAARTMYHTNHGSPEWDTAYNMLMEAIDEREEAAREAAERERSLLDLLADAQHAVCCYSCPEPREGEPDRHCETCVRIGEALTRKGPSDER